VITMGHLPTRSSRLAGTGLFGLRSILETIIPCKSCRRSYRGQMSELTLVCQRCPADLTIVICHGVCLYVCPYPGAFTIVGTASFFFSIVGAGAATVGFPDERRVAARLFSGVGTPILNE